MRRNRFGLGGHFTNEQLEEIGEKARFLNILLNEVPEMGNEILELFHDFKRTCLSMGIKENEFTKLVDFEVIAELLLFKEKIMEWSTDWYINELWVIDSIFHTFSMWFEDERNRYKLFLFGKPTIGEIRKAYEKEFPDGFIKIPIFYAFAEKEVEYKSRINQIVMEHIKRSRAIFEGQIEGYHLAKEKRTDEHYKWFIHHHVFGKTVVETADDFGKDESKVRTQINRLYEILEFARET